MSPDKPGVRVGLTLLLLLASACQSKAPRTSPSSSPERVKNLTIMSTPPQDWQLNISSGQKSKNTLKAFDINIKNDYWTLKSPVANRTKDVFTLEIIHGEYEHQQLQLQSKNNLFFVQEGELKGQDLQVKSLQGAWELQAQSYESQAPWTHFQLHNVQGTFQR